MIKIKPSCENCEFFGDLVDDESDATVAPCHRFPPQVNISIRDESRNEPASENWAIWEHPHVLATDWCGEYKPFVAS